MISDEMLKAHQDIIQKKFPTVLVITEDTHSEECGSFISALGIPDERRGEFTKFLFEVLGPELEKRGFEFMGVMPFSVEEAKGRFPVLWEEWQKTSRNAASTTPVATEQLVSVP